MEPLTDEVVTIPVSDLHVLRAALNSGYHHSTVLDLGEQYRKLAVRPSESKLTQALKNALALVGTYIELATEEVIEAVDE